MKRNMPLFEMENDSPYIDAEDGICQAKGDNQQEQKPC